jgi:hypothetical protein
LRVASARNKPTPRWVFPVPGGPDEQQAHVDVERPALEPLPGPREGGHEPRLPHLEVVERAVLVAARICAASRMRRARSRTLQAHRTEDDDAGFALADLESGPAARRTGLGHGEGLVPGSVAQLR